jgi:TrmH family RNA methyltransferase
VLEGVDKPGNVGAVLRSADAAGVSALIVADGGTDLFNPNAIRASLGAIFTLPVAVAPAAAVRAWLLRQGFAVFAARVDAPMCYTAVSYRGRSAFVLGSEAYGLTDRWRGEGVTPVRLPMCGVVDSLNVSAAAAVLFFEAWRQRATAQRDA